MSGQEEPTAQGVDSILAEFDSTKNLLEAFCEKTRNLIVACLDDAPIRYQSIQARVKTRSKLRAKYTDPQKAYRQLSDITDLTGLRIITYYEDEVDAVAELIQREFDIDAKNSIDKRTVDPDRFGYHAINYVCRHSAQRLASVEYKKFLGVSCEIQITSVLRHAWAEIQHDWYDLKDAYPDEIKRRFYRMAALLEIAESEFLELRKKKGDYQRAIAVQIEANVPDIPLDSVSLRSFVRQDPLVERLDLDVATSRGMSVVAMLEGAIEPTSRLANQAGLKTIAELRSSLEKYGAAITEFAALCHPHMPKPTASNFLGRGACVYYLSTMLIGKTSTANLLNALRSVGYNTANAEALSAAARQVMAKYLG
jgi:putative GTP pyrophosphokinase